MKRRIIGLVLVLAVLCACAPKESRGDEAGDRIGIYFLSGKNDAGGGALTAEYDTVPEDRATVAALLKLLFAGPEGEGMVSPFPRGTAVRSWTVEDGLASVDLSEAYDGLSGAALTLADGCIVLTLCQLPEVEQVYLTVEGRPRPFRDQVLSPDDFLTENSVGEGRSLTAQLWFPREGQLESEERIIPLAAGDREDIALVKALLAGPESAELSPICPEGVELLSLTWQGDLCRVDVSGDWATGEMETWQVDALTRTLSQVHEKCSVELWIEGIGWWDYPVSGEPTEEPVRPEGGQTPTDPAAGEQ